MAGKSEIISLSPGDLFGFFFPYFFLLFLKQTNKKKQIQYWDVFVMPRNGVGKISHSGAFLFSSQFFLLVFDPQTFLISGICSLLAVSSVSRYWCLHKVLLPSLLTLH